MNRISRISNENSWPFTMKNRTSLGSMSSLFYGHTTLTSITSKKKWSQRKLCSSCWHFCVCVWEGRGDLFNGIEQCRHLRVRRKLARVLGVRPVDLSSFSFGVGVGVCCRTVGETTCVVLSLVMSWRVLMKCLLSWRSCSINETSFVLVCSDIETETERIPAVSCEARNTGASWTFFCKKCTNLSKSQPIVVVTCPSFLLRECPILFCFVVATGQIFLRACECVRCKTFPGFVTNWDKRKSGWQSVTN